MSRPNPWSGAGRGRTGSPRTGSSFGRAGTVREGGVAGWPTRGGAAGADAGAAARGTGSGGNGLECWKTVGVTVLFLFSLVVLFTVLQVTGLWDWLNPLTRQLAATPALAPHVEMYRIGRQEWGALQDEQARLAAWEAQLSLEAERLAEQERALREAQSQLELERRRLADWEAELEDRLALVERLEDEQRALQQLREMYEAMRPQEAARILADMSDTEIAALLADMDPRTAAAILAALPVEKAAVVSRQLGL